MRILEIGGGAGATTGFILSVLPEHCTEYVFTDASERFTTNAQHKFAQYPFAQFRTLDLARSPLEQGFDLNSFDLIIASGGLTATKDLRKTLDHVKQLLGSGGMLALAEPTHPWLYLTLICGLPKGWWLFDDDVRRDCPCISQESWSSLLHDAGFSDVGFVADCPEASSAQYSVILACGPQLTTSPALAPHVNGNGGPKAWLLFTDSGTAGRARAGAELALRLRQRGDTVFEVTCGARYAQAGDGQFSIRAGDPEDMRRAIKAVARQAPRLAGIIHFWSLDVETSEAMTGDELVSSARLGAIGALQLLQAVAATEDMAVDSVWFVTRAAQAIDGRDATLELAQSPLWGLGRVAMNEYQNLRCRLVDLATGAPAEIDSLLEELGLTDSAEDEIALNGELRYVRRLTPVSTTSMKGLGRAVAEDAKPFRFEVGRPGILDTLKARPLPRPGPGPREVEIEVAAAGLNFMDLMLVMGMLPAEAVADRVGGTLPGLECAGRVVAVGDQVTEFAIGDEVVAGGAGNLATHLTADVRFVARKPASLSFEQAAQIPDRLPHRPPFAAYAGADAAG